MHFKRTLVSALSVVAVSATTLSLTATEASAAGRVGMVTSTGTGVSSIKLAWPKYKGATKYKISYSKSYSMKRAKVKGAKTNKTTVTKLAKNGQEYCFQVRAYNTRGKHIATSRRYCKPTARVSLPSSGLTTSALTYNICSLACDADKSYRKKNFKLWNQRRPVVTRTILNSRADLVGIQESSGWKTISQDIGGTYGLVMDSPRHVTAHLAYRKSRFGITYDSNGAERGGVLAMGNGRNATWAELQDLASGHSYIFVSAHVTPGKSASGNAKRKREVTSLLSQVNARNTKKLPVIFVGDWNSNKSRGYRGDTPTRVFEKNGYYDAFDQARVISRGNYNSGTNGFIKPAVSYTHGDHVDRLWVRKGAGIGVYSWANISPMRNGKYAAPMGSDHAPILVKLRTRSGKPVARPAPPVIKPPVVTVPKPKPTPQPPPPASIPIGPYNSVAKTFVLGDSISNPPAGETAWWGHVQSATKTNITASAIGGTGMLNSGAWGGGTFGSRLPQVDTLKPNFIIVAGGRNDWGYSNGVRPTPEAQESAILGFMADLAQKASSNGIPAKNVYIMNYWGTDAAELRAPIVAAMKKGAKLHGFEFVETALIPANYTVDGTHPSYPAGAQYLANRFLADSTYAANLASWAPPAAPPVPAPTPPKLTQIKKDLTITQAGTVIENAEIFGRVSIKAPNVTIRNSVIRGQAPTGSGIVNSKSPGVLIENTKIFSDVRNPDSNGIMGYGFTLNRVEIRNVVDQVHIHGDNVTIKNSWLHSNTHYEQDPNWGGKPSHDDNIQITKGNNILVENTTIQDSHNAAIMMGQDQGAISNVTLRGNVIGGGACSVNLSEKSYGPLKNIRVENNTFKRTQTKLPGCAVIAVASSVPVMVNNTWHETGATVTPTRG